LNIPNNANPDIFIQCTSGALQTKFAAESAVFQSLTRSGQTNIIGAKDTVPAGCLKSYINEDLTIYVKVAGLIDINLEIQRVNKRNI